MRCVYCGWVVRAEACPCGATTPSNRPFQVPVGTRVIARPGRGPSMFHWASGEVAEHLGPLHLVHLSLGDFWCEAGDILPESAERAQGLREGVRVWARWLDGRWFPGTIDAQQGPLRHVTWDDGDAMWLDPLHIVRLVKEATPQVDTFVIAPRWDGEHQPARVEQQDGKRFRVTFQDGEEAWVDSSDIQAFPPSPFFD